MLQRGLDYAAGTVMICAVCAAMLLLAAEILSFSSPVADAAATLGGAVLLNSLRRRLRTMAKHRSGPGTRIYGRAIEFSSVSMLARRVACVTAAPARALPAPDRNAAHPSKASTPSPV